jgi:hypothetical protein
VRWALVLLLACCGRYDFGTVDAHRDGIRDVPPDLLADAGVPGAVVHFELEDMTMTYVDTLGGEPGTCVPPTCPTAAPGRHGQGMHFDGVDDCIVVPDTQGYFETQAITLAIWAHQDPGATTAISQFSIRADPSGNARNSWQMEDYMDGTLAFTSNHGAVSNVQALSAPGAIINGQWQHLAISWDGATKRIYIDGARVASMPVGMPLYYDGHPADIGCDDNGGNSEVFLGTLDDFIVYDRALTDAEVALLATL